MEAEFQLPLKEVFNSQHFFFKSVASWCREEHPSTKTSLKFPWIDNCFMVTK